MRAITMEHVRVAQKPRWRPVIYFGMVWMALGIAPILVSGYYSPRHMYLASLGWSVALGIALDILWTPGFSRPIARRALRSATAPWC